MNASWASRARLRLPLPAARALALYLCFVMSLLFVQGSGSLALRLIPSLEPSLPWLIATLMNGNIPHAVLHIVWGLLGLAILATQRSARARLRLGVVFGTFYTALGFLGLLVTNPFGMRLAWQENAFHLTIGPLMLLLAWLATRGGENHRLPGRNAHA
jgi:hypothetical protein